jgi:alkylation response protein AidB-like acyl-CoA dehydrogenase
MSDDFSPGGVLERARALEPLIRSHRDAIEQGRRLPQTLVDAIANAGLFRMWLPKKWGGGEVDPLAFISVVEEISRVDGSVGWCVMLAAGAGVLSGYLPETGGQEIYGSDPNAVTAGFFFPGGKAKPVPGGYRVTGRWPFGSCSPFCTWLHGNCLVMDGEQPALWPDGSPKMRMMYFPKSDFKVLDTWSTLGLRGTGSHDFVVEDAFVPEDRTMSLADRAVQPGSLYAHPLLGLLANVLASVTLGIARGAIDASVALAQEAPPSYSPSNRRRDRALVQIQVAQAEGTLRASRALIADVLGTVGARVKAGQEVSVEDRAWLRLAAVQATAGAASVVDLMYTAAGANAIHTRNSLERALRDVHTARQHIIVQPDNLAALGRVFLGLPANAIPPL